MLIEIPSRGRPAWLLMTLVQLYNWFEQCWDPEAHAVIVLLGSESDWLPESDMLIRHFQDLDSGGPKIKVDVVGPEMPLPEKHQYAMDSFLMQQLIMVLHDDLQFGVDFLTMLELVMDDNPEIGAAAGVYPLVQFPLATLPNEYREHPEFNGRLAEAVNWHQVYEYPASDMQSFRTDVEHLFGPIMYRRKAVEEAGGFPVGRYSRVSHREETDMTYRIFKAGWKLAVVKHATALHFMTPVGGAAQDRGAFLKQDEEAFHAAIV